MDQGNATLRHAGYSSMQIAEREVEDTVLPSTLKQGVGVIIRVPLGSGLLSGKYTPESQFPGADRRSTGTTRADIKEQMERRFAAAEKLRGLAQTEGISMVHAALGWVLSHPEVSVVIPGAKTSEQAEDNAAASDVVLSSAFLKGA